MRTAWALFAATGSALCYGAGSVLEQIGARREPAAATIDPRLLLRLTRRLPWLAGAGLDAAGWLLSLVALRTLPLFAVQSAVAGSVGVTALLSAAVFAVRPSTRQRRALIVLGAGLVLLGVAAAPAGPGHMHGAGRWLLTAGPTVVALAAFPVARAAQGEAGAARLGILAGISFSGVALAGHVLHVPSRPIVLLADPLVWALTAYGLMGTLLFALALQRGSATSASAAVFATETALPALVGLALLGDRARPALGWVAAAGFVATVAGALALAFSPPCGCRSPSNGDRRGLGRRRP